MKYFFLYLFSVVLARKKVVRNLKNSKTVTSPTKILVIGGSVMVVFTVTAVTLFIFHRKNDKVSSVIDSSQQQTINPTANAFTEPLNLSNERIEFIKNLLKEFSYVTGENGIEERYFNIAHKKYPEQFKVSMDSVGKFYDYEKSTDFSWIEKILNKSYKKLAEEFNKETQKYINQIAARYLSLGQIREIYKNLPSDPNEKAKINFVGGLEVEKIQLLTDNQIGGKNIIIQGASQENSLEAGSSTSKTKVIYYPADNTQGPILACRLLIRSLLTESFVKHEKKKYHLLYNIFKDKKEFIKHEDNDTFTIKIAENNQEKVLLQNGYLKFYNLTPNFSHTKMGQLLEEKQDQMLVFPEWTKAEQSGKEMLALFQFAPSFQSKQDKGKDYKGVIRDIIVPQYEAIAKIAAIQATLKNQEVNLHLNLLGGGSFKCFEYVQSEVLKTVKESVKGFKVNVFFHIFTKTSWDEKINTGYKNELKDNAEVTVKFFNKQFLEKTSIEDLQQDQTWEDF